MVAQTKKPPLTVSNPWWGHDPSDKQLEATIDHCLTEVVPTSQSGPVPLSVEELVDTFFDNPYVPVGVRWWCGSLRFWLYDPIHQCWVPGVKLKSVMNMGLNLPCSPRIKHSSAAAASVNTSARAFVIPADANGGGKSGHPRYRGQNPGLIRGRGKDRRRVPGYGNLHGHDSVGFPRRQVPKLKPKWDLHGWRDKN